jgi:hypothetical protein
VARAGQVGVHIDRRKLGECERGRCSLGDSRELKGMGATGLERLRHRERPVPERRLRGDQFEVDPVAGERAQREQRFQPGHAAAGDDNVETVEARRTMRVRHRRKSPAPRAGRHPRTVAFVCGKPTSQIERARESCRQGRRGNSYGGRLCTAIGAIKAPSGIGEAEAIIRGDEQVLRAAFLRALESTRGARPAARKA